MTPSSPLTDGFAHHIARWAQRAGAAEPAVALAEAAAILVSAATAEGHVCAHVDALPPPWQAMPPDELHDALLATGVVADDASAEPAPLFADGNGRLYLWRYHDYERRLASALHALAQPFALAAADIARLRTQLDQLFPADPQRSGPDRQKLAAALALQRGLTVISGGPGTGKTHTVIGLLAALLAQAPDTRVALAAPTGKAAARMMETLRGRIAHLPEAIRSRLPAEAWTVHRLLGVTSEAGRFRHDRDNPLPIDALVVDEASMLDLALATRLIEAMPKGARLILLGDKDQLAAVEAGAVFAELSAGQAFTPACAAALAELAGCAASDVSDVPSGPAALADSVIWLSESRRFRADSGIGRLAADVKAGRGEAAIEWMQAGADTAVRWIDDAADAPGENIRATLLAGYAPYFQALGDAASGRDPAALMQAFDRYRILCAVQAGPRGVAAINDFIGQRVRRLTTTASSSPWYRGRAVMILHNDYALRVFNGDIGICVPDAAGEPVVAFPDAASGWRYLTPSRLPEHADAFAITVHKSQGSEFERVHLLLPERAGAVLTRELVYTGVTRAAQAVEVSGEADVFVNACRTPTRRRSGLAGQLALQQRG
ncbi:exodeoxyribonuclease V subunit alpha [Niveibacterium sp. 24ML]|uniref:exodeoxyribonuclease V subunit alpha n=1 Tax=Niveibacterium sp. 24ML TaxID=2985512 RepID=UPI00226FF030|nr:exodeoxyribonuclease V subunit alpha [Niveibacterium sp. 24ML]MCX9157224.1 exodeoxyribonuclease V subunit alpha [Niveibacterium sp. 24ML]